MPAVIEESLDMVVERARALIRPRRRTLLGVAGAPGAGKSTLVEAMAARLGQCAAVVGMDAFHLAGAELQRLQRTARKGAPDTFDSFGYAALLSRLRANQDPVVYAPRFDRALEEPVAGAVAVPREVPLVITEGNYLLLDTDAWPAARSCLDAVWFLDVADDLRVQRLVQRHEQYGMSREVARRRATEGSDDANARLVASMRHRADLLLRVLT